MSAYSRSHGEADRLASTVAAVGGGELQYVTCNKYKWNTRS
jgi:hypothetical protein